MIPQLARSVYSRSCLPKWYSSSVCWNSLHWMEEVDKELNVQIQWKEEMDKELKWWRCTALAIVFLNELNDKNTYIPLTRINWYWTQRSRKKKFYLSYLHCISFSYSISGTRYNWKEKYIAGWLISGTFKGTGITFMTLNLSGVWIHIYMYYYEK